MTNDRDINEPFLSALLFPRVLMPGGGLKGGSLLVLGDGASGHPRKALAARPAGPGAASRWCRRGVWSRTPHCRSQFFSGSENLPETNYSKNANNIFFQLTTKRTRHSNAEGFAWVAGVSPRRSDCRKCGWLGGTERMSKWVHDGVRIGKKIAEK